MRTTTLGLWLVQSMHIALSSLCTSRWLILCSPWMSRCFIAQGAVYVARHAAGYVT